MGKLLGLFFGFFVFGPIGSLLGLVLGSLFDANIKIFNRDFFSDDMQFRDELLIRSFPILCAEIITANRVDRQGVLAVKNIMLQFFDKNIAKEMMNKFKNLIENGYSPYKIESVCEEIKYNIDAKTKLNLINILSRIMKDRGLYSTNEVETLKKIGQQIGININFSDRDDYQKSYFNDQFYEYFYNTYNSYQNQNQNNYYRDEPKDYYKILGLKQDATNEEIKKQYRSLCKKYHPDVVNNLPESDKKNFDEKIKEIIDAYEEIKNERGFK